MTLQVQFQTLASGGHVDLDPTDTIQEVKCKLSPLVGFPGDEILLTLGGSELGENSRSVKDLKIDADSTLLVVRTQWDEHRFEGLKTLFTKRGELHARGSCLSADVELPEGLALPPGLQALLRIAPKWNFTKGSCDVFNCNLFLMSPRDSDIFGDTECRQEWATEHGEESCAGEDWACICASSEYDFYFVNLRKASPLFGTTRHIVNNCNEEEIFSEPPFERFLDAVEAYAERNSALEPEEGEDEADIEYEPFMEFQPRRKKPRCG